MPSGAADAAEDVENAKFRLFNGLPMSTGHVALLADVDTRTITNWCREGKLAGAIRLPSGKWLIPASEVRRAITGAAALRAGPG